MSLVSLIDAGKHEIYSKTKKLTKFDATVSSKTETKQHKGPITMEVLQNAKAIWFFGPQRDLTENESSDLERFLRSGGSILIFGSKFPPVFTSFLKKFGVTILDQVISPAYTTYVDPKVIAVQSGVVNRGLTLFAKNQDITFAFPDGCTLDCKKPSVPIITSGQISYPLNQPILSFATVGQQKGTLTVCGSPHIFNDEWLPKENNEILLRYLIEISLTKSEQINQIDADHPEVTERWYSPDVLCMSNHLRSCIQEPEKLRNEFQENFDTGLFRMDMSFVTESQNMSNLLGLKNEPLEIVEPQFDTALPPLTPAVYPPQMREPPGPALELFDLDDAFALPKTRLAQLAQRTSQRNAEKFTVQAAKILGIMQKLPEDKQSGKHVLEYVLNQIMRWKRQTQD
ncbi:intraflagellar transport protein [Histomonas meleagridis]|uniref:intraflagellar transport protein 52-like n=1 Tax=Histomonas meleagridis TaxID=135588 RepID=UPI00355A9778|nr:intraflagellar transport protein [Histomonas meleagridis]KAH0800429.1 intraflagellar transport protein 52-like [Histomonas meleagridis]